MARPRVQVGSGLEPVPFRPAASPVNRFTRTSEGQQISQLANSLARFSHNLRGVGLEAQQGEITRLQEEGEAAAREMYEEGLSYKEAIEAGRIKPQDSPWFRLGAEEFFGRNAAMTYGSDLQTALRESGLSESGTDVAQFEEFERDFRAQWLSQNVGASGRTRYFERAFGGALDQTVAASRANFAAKAGTNLVNQAKEAVHQSVYDSALQSHAGDVDSTEFAQAIRLDTQRAIAMGVSAEEANKSAAEAIVNAAIQTGDVSVLDIMDDVQLGSGPMGNTSWAVAMKRDARRVINSQQQEARDEDIYEAEDEYLRAVAVSGYNSAEAQEALDALTRIPGGARRLSSVTQSAASFRANRESDDPSFVRSLGIMVTDGTMSVEELRGYAGQLEFGNYMMLRNLAMDEQRRRAMATGDTPSRPELEKAAFDDPIYKMYNTIGVDMLTKDGLMDQNEAALLLAEKQGDILVNFTEWYAGGGWQQPVRTRRGVMERLVYQAASDQVDTSPEIASASQDRLMQMWSDPGAMTEESFEEFHSGMESGDLGDLSAESLSALRTLVPNPTPEHLRGLWEAQRRIRGRTGPIEMTMVQEEWSPAQAATQQQDQPGDTRASEAQRRFTQELSEIEEEIQEIESMEIPEEATESQRARRERFNASRVQQLRERQAWLRERLRIIENS